MSIVFSKSGMSNLTLERGRLFPFSEGDIEINQDRYLTEDNNPIVINYGDNLELVVLSFSFLTKDNYDGAVNGLKTWFEDSNIEWSSNSFTLTDENGVAHTVRYWDDKFSMPKNVNGRYSGKLILLKE